MSEKLEIQVARPVRNKQRKKEKPSQRLEIVSAPRQRPPPSQEYRVKKAQARVKKIKNNMKERRDARDLQVDSFPKFPNQVRQFREKLAASMGRTLGGMLNPASGGFRLCDSVATPTAVMMSTATYPIFADPTVENGAFVALCQPRLGNLNSPSQYRVALPIPANVMGDYSKSSTFLASYGVQSPGGNDPRLMPDLPQLLASSPMQCSFYGLVTEPAGYTNGQNLEINGWSFSGTNTSQFGTFDAGNSVSNWTANHGGILVPAGTLYHYATLTVGDTYTTPTIKYSGGQNNNKVMGWHYDLVAIDRAGNATQVDWFHIAFTTSNGGPGSYNDSQGSGKYIKYVYGHGTSATGSGSSTSNDFEDVYNVRFYTEIPPSDELTYVMLIYYPGLLISNTLPFNFNYYHDVTSTTLGIPVQSNDSLIQRVRTTGYQVWFKPTVAALNNGGSYILAQLPAADQDDIFSPTGANFVSYTNVSSMNLPGRNINKPISTGGAICNYVPEQLLDSQLYGYQVNSNYKFPTLVLTGYYNPATPTAGSVKIGDLTISHTIEYTTDSRVVEKEYGLGTDALYEAVISNLGMVNNCVDNPTHKEWFDKIINFCSSGIAAVTNILPYASSILTASAAIGAIFFGAGGVAVASSSS